MNETNNTSGVSAISGACIRYQGKIATWKDEKGFGFVTVAMRAN
jgi:hypothetical protein